MRYCMSSSPTRQGIRRTRERPVTRHAGLFPTFILYGEPTTQRFCSVATGRRGRPRGAEARCRVASRNASNRRADAYLPSLSRRISRLTGMNELRDADGGCDGRRARDRWGRWKTSSGEVPELPQLPACVLVPLVVPLKVPPWAGIWVGLPQAPPASVVVVVELTLSVVLLVVEAPGGVTVRLKVPCAPPYPSTTMKYVCPAVTVGVMREALFAPVALGQASSLHPAATSGPLAHTPLRT